MTEESNNGKLFWEPAADLRWGKYLSEIEERHILFAHESAIAAAGDGVRSLKALEVGAEGGRWAKLLDDRGWQMTCTDINAEAMAVCQQRLPKARCVVVDIESDVLPVEDESQDLILCIEVNEVLEAPWFLEEMDRVLKPGGQVVGVFQNRSSLRGALKMKFPNPGDDWPHYRHAFRPWLTELQARNFQLIKAEGMCWMPFGRTSNSRLIPTCVALERFLGLRKLVRFSPWITLVARKSL